MLLSLISITGFSQLSDTIFYDGEWNITTSPNCQYYRVYTNDPSIDRVLATNYYKNGNVQMSGYYNSIKGKKKTGEFIWYYEDGKKKEFCNYKKDVKTGYSCTWYPNGSMDCAGNYVNGMKDGKWFYFFMDSLKSAEITFSGDQVIDEVYWNSDGSILTNKDEANRDPEYPGGLMNLKLFIANNLVYPENLGSKGIQATVDVQFVVDSEGYIKDIRIINCKYPEFNKEALRVFESATAKWEPGKEFNRYADFEFTLPVVFTQEYN